MDRRRFTFGSLGAMAAGRAGAAPRDAPAGPRLVGMWAVERERDAHAVLAALTVRDDGPAQVHLLVTLGREPGARVGSAVDGEPLVSLSQPRWQELASQAGPQPRYVALAAGQAAGIGPYRFAPEAVTLQADVCVEYETVPLPPVTVPIGRAGS